MLMDVSLPIRIVFFTLLGYLCGNVMNAYWIPRWLKNVDVRDFGADRNPGASNATVACGLPVGILCAVLDILKGTVPVLLAVYVGGLWDWPLVPVVLSPVIGHAWPLLFHGRGGKAIATSFGVLIGLMPMLLLALLWALLLLACLPFIHDHSTLIIVTTTLMTLVGFALYPQPFVHVLSCGVSGVLIYKHLPQRRRGEDALVQATVGEMNK